MTQRSRYHLSDAEKDALLEDQAALIEAHAARIKDLGSYAVVAEEDCKEFAYSALRGSQGERQIRQICDA